MRYKNGKDVLPSELLAEIQKYVKGEMIYIPQCDAKAPWGEISGARNLVDQRNRRIIHKYDKGHSVNELIVEFCLSESSIRKIVYSSREREKKLS